MRASFLVGVLVLASCGTDSSGLTVYAAASLRDSFEELATAYASETGVELTLSFDASSTLRTQIEQGAPADVFASADTANAQALVDAGMAHGDPVTFARNRLAIVVPLDGNGIDDWQALASPGVRIVAAGGAVPITRYAHQLVENLARLPDAPPSFAESYGANVISEEDNVRAVLAKIELGEGDAGIVYETDARSSADVATLPLPDAANVSTDDVAVAVSSSDAADRFVDWLTEDAAQRILAAHGFRPPL